MDAGLLWTAAGTAAGVLGVVLVAWQVRLQHLERRERRSEQDQVGEPTTGDGGLPVAVPLGLLPGEVRGRDALLAELRRRLSGRRGRVGDTWVLAGMGGLGKSTVALSVAQEARAVGWRVWWVSAVDPASLTGGMVEVLRQMGAPGAVVRLVRAGAPAAADRAWEFLSGGHGAGRRWLLIFDNADFPAVLAADGAGSPADHTGWLRPDPAGMLIVTSRVKDPGVWGPEVRMRELRPLDDVTGARVLADLAPGISDEGGDEAIRLSHRLGGLPLALHLAGSYLASPFAAWRTFAEYRSALDGTELPAALAEVDQPGTEVRATIQRTWDLSLDALDAEGRRHARPLLFLLCCYAPAIPIPAALINLEALVRMPSYGATPGTNVGGEDAAEQIRRLRDSFRGLAAVGLIDVTESKGDEDARSVTVHPVVADANRSRLLVTARSELPAVSEAAVQLMRAACGALDCESPEDWPAWRSLAPHISALLDWAAVRLGDVPLAALVDVSGQTADALRRAGSPAAAENMARSGVAAAARLGRAHPAALTAQHKMLQAIGEQGRNSEAERLYRDLLSDQMRVLGDGHPQTLAVRYDLAWMVEYQGRYSEAGQLCGDVFTGQRQTLGEDHPDTLTTRTRLARLTALEGRYREAERLTRHVLADRQRVLGNGHPDTLVARHNLAWMIALQGRHAEAEFMMREVLADRQRILGDRHPSSLTTRRRLARTIADQGRYKEAEPMLHDLLAELEAVQGQDHPATLAARGLLARVIGLQGRLAEAEQLCRRILGDWDRIHGSHWPAALAARHSLGWMIAWQGRHAEAEHVLALVLAERQQVLGDDHPDTQNTRARLAEAIASQGRYEQAQALLITVLAQREDVLGAEHQDTIQTRNDLAHLKAARAKATSQRKLRPVRYAHRK